MKRALCCALSAVAVIDASAEVNWTVYRLDRLPGKPPTVLNGVAYGNGMFVSLGEQGEVYRALDPNQWESLNTIDQVLPKTIGYGAGLFVVSAFDQALNESVMLTSADGTSWIHRRLGTGKWLHRVVYGNGQFVAIGYDIIARSADGSHWTIDDQFVQEPQAEYLAALTFANGRFISALGRLGMPSFTFLRSTNGANWERSQVHSPNAAGIAYGRNKYLAVSAGYDCSGCGASNLVSADGLNWTEIAPASGNKRAIAYGNGVFAVAAYGATWASQKHELLSSKDMLHWSSFEIKDGSVLDLTFGANRFVAVGQGVIIVSDEIEFQPLLSNVGILAAKIYLEADAPEGTTWDVEASEDLSEWSLVGEVKGTASAFESVSVPISEGQRFLRLVDRGGNP